MQGADLPWPFSDLVPSWLPVLSPVHVESDDRPLFMAVAYDLDRCDGSMKQVEQEVEHASFDHETFSAAAGGLRLDQQADPDRIDLEARTGHFHVKLGLRAEKPFVVFGETSTGERTPVVRQGPLTLSYAERPRLTVRAEHLVIDGERISDFEGDAVQDRQWLTVTATGIKWIWLQMRLSDGREIVGYVMRDSLLGPDVSPNEGRRLDGSGHVIEADGRCERLEDFDLSSSREHELETPRGRVPCRFHLVAGSLRVTLEHIVKDPFLPLKALGPSLDGGIWEGPARIIDASEPITGRAWVEVMSSSCVRLV